jgi:hypothetical protein
MPKTMASIVLMGDGPGREGTVHIDGIWQSEAFAVGDTATPVTLAKEQWQRVELIVQLGKPTAVQVDGEPIGQMPAGAKTGLTFDVGHHGYRIDDIEIVYEQ